MDIKEDTFSTVVSEISAPKFIAGYHIVTLALFPTVVLPGLLVLLPMAMGGFLTAMVASLAINMLLFLLLVFRKKVRAREILKLVYIHERREWGPAAVLAIIYAAGYYLLVGRHWLATIPSVSRLPYLPLFGIVVFASISIYSFMIQEVLFPLVDAKMSRSGEKARSAVKIMLGAEMPFSFFFILLLVPSVIMGNFFLMLPVYLMIPIFTVSSLLGLLFKKHGWSALPATLIIVVIISLVVTTISPLGFLSPPALG